MLVMNYQTADLPSLILAVNDIAAETKSTFGRLSPLQLNWKPSPERWSVAQCFDHLITTNQEYFPAIDEVLAGKKRTLWQRMPVLPGIGGKLLMKFVDPESGRKVKAPKIFQPAQSDVTPSILNDFIEQQTKLVERMKATAHLDLENLVISSPVTSVMTYSLMDAYRILVLHETRHFQQAQRVTEEPSFHA
jgi:DinB family protein